MNNIYLKEWGLKGKIKNIEDLNFLLSIEGNNIKKTLKDRKKIEIDYDQIRTKPTIIRTTIIDNIFRVVAVQLRKGISRKQRRRLRNMKIIEIKLGMSGITVEGKITDKSESRNVQTRYGPRSVCDATLEDETGTIKLSLWEEKIDMINIGDKIMVSETYVTEFRNQLQLNMPRSGKLEIKEKNIQFKLTRT